VKKLILFLVVLWPAISVLAQRQQIQQDTDSIPQKPKARLVSNIIFQFDNRNEKYYDVQGRMNGLRIGVEFYKRVRVGFGFYENSNFYELKYPGRPDTLSKTISFRYTTNFGELVLYRNFRWELSHSLAFGKGQFAVNKFDTHTSVPEFIGRDTIYNARLFDLGLHTHYKIFPWFGLGLGAGYRSVYVHNHPELRTAFSDPYFEFKIKLFIGYIYKGIFKPEVIKAEKAYYDYRRKQRKKYFENLLKQ